jgi:hypothetical protein
MMRSIHALFLALCLLALTTTTEAGRRAPKTKPIRGSPWGVTNVSISEEEKPLVELAFRSRFVERIHTVSEKYHPKSNAVHHPKSQDNGLPVFPRRRNH